MIDQWVAWTARLTVLLYSIRVVSDVLSGGSDLRSDESSQTRSLRQIARWAWTFGAVVNVTHLLIALGGVHGWSHRAALLHTAEQTERVVGVAFGGGVFANYLFSAFWILDALVWWRTGVDWAYRSRFYFWLVHSLFAFFIFNATVVFGPDYWKGIGAAFMIVLLLAWRLRKRFGQPE